MPRYRYLGSRKYNAPFHAPREPPGSGTKNTTNTLDRKEPLAARAGNQASPVVTGSVLASEVAKARQHIKNSLECMDSVAVLAGVPNTEISNKINTLENENSELKKAVDDLRKLVISLQVRVESLETAGSSNSKLPKIITAAKVSDDSDDGVDLFGSDDEEENAEAAKLREDRLAAYNAKKAKKPVLIAKSNIILDVKPWDDETDMKAMEDAVRKITTDGLLWGAAKLVPLAFGIKKLQISCVVEDEKISVDWLTEEIEKLEDLVQSVDIAAFNKV
ncbi:jg11523 [Pararge aegeria aegeria]|uniref:Jg11523 protein n=1 Tax=Pararge aegeria aegeria TaxID=348720 RepID=A0A8S4RLT0_9NEOP|nr:jg11523 [Pararge aegeria aegeria]